MLFGRSAGRCRRDIFSREGALEFPILIRLICITGRVTVSGKAQAEEARDEKKTLGQAPGPGSEVEDVNLHCNGFERSAARMTRAGNR